MADLGEKFVIKHSDGTIEKAHVYSTRDECYSDDVMKIGDGYVPLKKYNTKGDDIAALESDIQSDISSQKIINTCITNRTGYTPNDFFMVMKQAEEPNVPFVCKSYATVSDFTELNDNTKGAMSKSSYLKSSSLTAAQIGIGGYCEIGYQHITFPKNVTSVLIAFTTNVAIDSSSASNIKLIYTNDDFFGKPSNNWGMHYLTYKVTPGKSYILLFYRWNVKTASINFVEIPRVFSQSWEILPATEEVEQNIKNSCLKYFQKIGNPLTSSPKYEIAGELLDPWDGTVNGTFRPAGEGYMLLSGGVNRTKEQSRTVNSMIMNARPFLAYGDFIQKITPNVDITY